MKRLKVKIPENEYDIIIDNGLLNKVDSLIKEVYKRNKIFIITDDNVYLLHAKKVEEYLRAKRF